jgi:arylformamidase
MTSFDPDWLDRMYNNRALVPEHAAHFARWSEQSAAARASQPCTLDIAYGRSAGETLDVFAASEANSPVVVFIHGGYWRSLDKSDHSFIAPAFTAEGACVVVPNYDLCPAVTIPQIALQTAQALAWTWRNVARFGGDPARITVIGHSAGGHLAAMMLACLWPRHADDLPADLVKNALAISGLYELESIMHTPFLKDALRLTPEQVRQASPAWFPPPARGTLYTVAGADESPEFFRHNELIRKAWGPGIVPVCESLPALNHFSVVEALVQPGHRLNDLALQLIAHTGR